MSYQQELKGKSDYLQIINKTKDSTDLQNDINPLICWEKQWSAEFHANYYELRKSNPTEVGYVMHTQKLY